MKVISTAILAAGLLAVASAATAGEREAVSLRIDTSGVNFADPVAVAAFHRQVERQIEAVCNPGDRINSDTKPDFACRKEMAASLDPTLYQLAARASGRRIAGS